MGISSIGGLPQGAVIGVPMLSLPTNVSLQRTYTTTTTGITGLPEFVFAVMIAGGCGGAYNGASKTGGGGGSLNMAWIPAPTKVTIGAGGGGSSTGSFGGDTYCDTYGGNTYSQPGASNGSGGRFFQSLGSGTTWNFAGTYDLGASGTGGNGANAGGSGFFAGGGGGATTAAATSGGSSTKFGYTGGTGAGTGTTWGSGGGAGIAGNGTNGSASAAGNGGVGGGGGGAASTGITSGGTGGVGAVLLYW